MARPLRWEISGYYDISSHRTTNISRTKIHVLSRIRICDHSVQGALSPQHC